MYIPGKNRILRLPGHNFVNFYGDLLQTHNQMVSFEREDYSLRNLTKLSIALWPECKWISQAKSAYIAYFGREKTNQEGFAIEMLQIGKTATWGSALIDSYQTCKWISQAKSAYLAYFGHEKTKQQGFAI